ncbi:AMP-binding protein [Plantactinospora sp. KLBMP9567]|uniref:AMP-binding protein n=1 Tax=Plantactinospora sp. KLBMP9567 TaxID=3085900 RepID=UPI002982643B|nr:AMP-binding protein [Plantactinospora sp. KLBMP9567]MDW5324854.1 AMP-binding protein [Plantactinospora sp. KLBMP9567]
MTRPQPASVTLPAEQRELIETMNSRTAPVPPGTLAERALAVAAAHRERIAVVSPRETLSYGQLLDQVADLADRLCAAGVGPGSRVALSVELGWEQLAGALAIMRVGAAYAPVPPNLPRTVRWEALSQVKATVVVTQWWLTDRIEWPDGTTVLSPEEEPTGTIGLGDGGPHEGATAAVLPLDPVAPDGARRAARTAVGHTTVLNAVTDVARRLGLGADDRVFAQAPVESVLSLHEMFTGVLAGATLVFGQDVDVRHPAAWLAQFRRDAVTAWLPTPSLLNMLLDHLAATGESWPATLRTVLLSGEPLHPDRLRELRSVAGRDLTVAYATAAAPQDGWVALCDLTEPADDWRSVPIGRPLANNRLYLLTETLAPCPVWVTGRLHVGGLAARTSDDPDWAAPGPSVPHPETGEPLVPTALFGRLRPEGVIEAVGDDSSRIVVHGRPLNLRDTETALDAHQDVRQAVVVPVAESTESVGYVRPRTGRAVSAEELTGYLRRKVSPYLMPARIEVVGALPLTSDGRVDRRALGSPPPAARTAPSGPDPAPTADERELIRRVTEVACRLFDVGDIEPNANLLDIGATSYQLVRLATVLEESLGVVVEVEELLRFPSIAVIVSSHLAALPESVPPVPGPPAGSASAVAGVGTEEAAGTEGAAGGGTLTGLLERQAFKDARYGVRTDLDDGTAVDLATPADERIGARRTVRSFEPDPVDLADLAGLLGAARAIRRGGEPKFWYPSAGGAYPVQVYLLAAPGRVRGLPGGSYYYHPDRNALVPIDPDAALPASAHLDLNRAAFRQSAFSLYLIGRMTAIRPLYAELSWDFTVFEAGALTQAFGLVAAERGLGLCPVGTMDSGPLPALFRLADQDRFVHALLGGVPADGGR